MCVEEPETTGLLKNLRKFDESYGHFSQKNVYTHKIQLSISGASCSPKRGREIYESKLGILLYIVARETANIDTLYK